MSLAIEPGLLLSIITVVAGVTIYFFLKSRHIERMQQMQMGIPLTNDHRSYFELKFGLLFVGIGVGVLAAFVLNRIGVTRAPELYPALIFLFGGLGLVASFFVVQNYRRK